MKTTPSTVFQVHKQWLVPAILVLLLTVLADGLVVSFARRPIFWAVLIPATLPLSIFFFVTRPVLREANRRSDASPQPK